MKPMPGPRLAPTRPASGTERSGYERDASPQIRVAYVPVGQSSGLTCGSSDLYACVVAYAHGGNPPPHPSADRPMALWLLVCCAMILLMVALACEQRTAVSLAVFIVRGVSGEGIELLVSVYDRFTKELDRSD
jgi:hypothetical protein